MKSMFRRTAKYNQFLTQIKILQAYCTRAISLFNNLRSGFRRLRNIETVPINKRICTKTHQIQTPTAT